MNSGSDEGIWTKSYYLTTYFCQQRSWTLASKILMKYYNV